MTKTAHRVRQLSKKMTLASKKNEKDQVNETLENNRSSKLVMQLFPPLNTRFCFKYKFLSYAFLL